MEFSYATTTSEADWESWVTQNVAVQHGGISLPTRSKITESTVADAVRDFAVGPDAELFTVATTGEVDAYDPQSGSRERLLDRSQLDDPRAICASDSQVFVLDGADNTLTVVSTELNRRVGTLRAEVSSNSELTYTDGTIYAVDEDGIRAIDQSGSAERVFDVIDDHPTDLQVQGEKAYVLERTEEDSSIRAFGQDGDVRTGPFPIPNWSFVCNDTQLIPTSLAILADSSVVAGKLAGTDEHGLFAYDDNSGAFAQLHSFEHRPRELIGAKTATGKRIFYLIGGHSRTCFVLRESTVCATDSNHNRHVGTAMTRYDSGVRDIEWHRITLGNVQSSPSTQVRLRYTATDEPSVLPLGTNRIIGLDPGKVQTLRDAGFGTIWQLVTANPMTVASISSDISLATVEEWQRIGRKVLSSHAESKWTTVDITDPDDVLLEDATGRYLFVAVELVGTTNASPRVESVRAYCPEISYLRYFPDIYRENRDSAAFLKQFLSVFETSFVDIESEIESITEWFDPHAVPSDSLSWLENWLAVDPGEDWPESARRELLARAPELYHKRGTRSGLIAMIDLYLRHTGSAYDGEEKRSLTRLHETGQRSSGEETDGSAVANRLFFVWDKDFQKFKVEIDSRLFDVLQSGKGSFVIFSDGIESVEQRRAVQEIVDKESPAHVRGTLMELEDEYALGDGTFLGINSALTSRQFIVGEGSLGENTVLLPRQKIY